MSYPQGQWQPAWPQQQYAPQPKKKRTGLIVGLVALLVVVITGGATAFLLADKEKSAAVEPQPSSSQAKAASPPLWTAKFTGGKLERDTELLGSWAADDVVVRGQTTGVVAYRAKSGEVAWQLPTDKVKYCGMSTDTTDGLGVIVFGGPKPGDEKLHVCNQFQAIEVATGKPKWTKESQPATDQFVANDGGGLDRPEIAGDIVIAQVGSDLFGLDLKTGERKWNFNTSENNPVSKEQGKKRGTCAISSWVVTPARAVLEQSCTERAFEIGGEITVVTSVDPRNGQKQWATALPTSIVAAGRGPNTPVPDVVSAEPPVLYLDRSMSKDGPYALLPFDGTTGAVGKEIELPGPLRTRAGRSVERAPVTLTKGNTIVTVVSGQANGGCDQVLGAYAIDISAGKAVWPKPKALGCDVSLAALDGDTVVALSAGSSDEAPSLYRIGLADGAEQHGRSLPADPDGLYLAGAVRLVGDALIVLPYTDERREHSIITMAVPD